MKKNPVIQIVLTAMLLAAFSAFAQPKVQLSATPDKPQAASEKSPPIPKDFHDEIVQLLDLIGSKSLAMQYSEAFNRMEIGRLKSQDPQFPQKEIDAVKEETGRFMAEKLPELIERLVPVYARHFTREEVRELIAFYKTPIGAKTIRELPLIASESLGVGNYWGKGVSPELQGRINARLQKDGYQKPKAPAAPPSPPEKK